MYIEGEEFYLKAYRVHNSDLPKATKMMNSERSIVKQIITNKSTESIVIVKMCGITPFEINKWKKVIMEVS